MLERSKKDAVKGLLLFVAGCYFYFNFLGETAKASYVLLIPKLSTPVGQQNLSAQHVEFFSEKINVPVEELSQNPFSSGIRWLGGEKIDCGFLGAVLALDRVAEADSTKSTEYVDEEPWIKSRVKSGLNASIGIIMHSDPDLAYKIDQEVRRRSELNLTVEKYCIADSMLSNLRDFAQEESEILIIDYVNGSFEKAVDRSNTLMRLFEIIKEE